MIFPASTSSSPLPLENVRLIRQNQTMLVSTPENAHSHPFEPFELPPIHKSLCNWMFQLADDFRQQYQRCLAILLFLDCQTRNWGLGIPSQRASHDTSCFWARRDDFAHFGPSIYVAGSFQTRIFSPEEQPADAVPNSDGLHLVLQVEGESACLFAFLRSREQLQSILPDRIILDDLTAALARCMDRVQLL